MIFRDKWQTFIDRLDRIRLGNLSASNLIVKSIIFIILLVSIPLMFSTEKALKYTDLKVGSVAPKKVVAPFDFYVLKTDQELQAERQEKIKEVPYYFEYSDSLTRLQLSQFDELLPLLEEFGNRYALIDSATIGDSLQQKLLLTLQDSLRKGFNLEISTANLNVILDILDEPHNRQSLKETKTLIAEYLQTGILDRNTASFARPRISIIRNGVEQKLPDSLQYSMQSVEEMIENRLLQSFSVNQTIALNYLIRRILQPNLLYQKEMTEEAVQQARSSVSLTKDLVVEDERIVDANERIDEEIYQKLYSLEVAKVERSKRESNWQLEFAFMGKMMMVAAILLIVGLYLYSYR
ncbi:MAG: hypothetical protein GF313_13590, partial [Caldithrix sp.]|nr:hypothetical protein [Caldithrix sp.]